MSFVRPCPPRPRRWSSTQGRASRCRAARGGLRACPIQSRSPSGASWRLCRPGHSPRPRGLPACQTSAQVSMVVVFPLPAIPLMKRIPGPERRCRTASACSGSSVGVLFLMARSMSLRATHRAGLVLHGETSRSICLLEPQDFGRREPHLPLLGVLVPFRVGRLGLNLPESHKLVGPPLLAMSSRMSLKREHAHRSLGEGLREVGLVPVRICSERLGCVPSRGFPCGRLSFRVKARELDSWLKLAPEEFRRDAVFSGRPSATSRKAHGGASRCPWFVGSPWRRARRTANQRRPGSPCEGELLLDFRPPLAESSIQALRDAGELASRCSSRFAVP